MPMQRSIVTGLCLALGCASADEPRTSSASVAIESLPEPTPLTPMTPTPAPVEPLTIAAVGDLMLGSTYPERSGARLPPDDGAHLFDDAAPILRAAELAFANLEAPLFDGEGPPHCTPGAIAEKNHGRPGATDCWAFRTPRAYASLLAEAGFDLLSIANNHIDDFGPEGRASTQAALDELGLAWSGPRGSVARVSVGGRAVELIAFATNPGLNDLFDLDAARDLVASADARAEIVIVSIHGGAEGPRARHVPDAPEFFHGEARGELRRFAHAVIDAGADLVLGHGPHVVRGLELHRERLIAYSLGSFATQRGISITGVRGSTLILELRLDAEGRWLDGRVIPFRQRRPDGPRLEPDGELIAELRRLSVADFGEAAPTIDDDGRLSPGDW